MLEASLRWFGGNAAAVQLRSSTNHPRIEAQGSQSSQHLSDVRTARSRLIDDQRHISHRVNQGSGHGFGRYAVKDGISGRRVMLRARMSQEHVVAGLCVMWVPGRAEPRSVQGLDHSNVVARNVTENLKNVLREPLMEMATAQQSLMVAITHPAHNDDGPVSRDCLPTNGSASTRAGAAHGSIGNGRKPPPDSSEQPVNYLAMEDIPVAAVQVIISLHNFFFDKNNSCLQPMLLLPGSASGNVPA